MSHPRNILLVGATGTIGSSILAAILSARKNFDRVVIFTSQVTAEAKTSHLQTLQTKHDVEILAGDIEDDAAIKAAYDGIETVISALSHAALVKQTRLIELAAASPHVKWFIPSEFGTDVAYTQSSACEWTHQEKLKVRDFLENKVSRTDLDYTYIVTGPIAEMYFQFIPEFPAAGGWDVKEKRSVLLGDDGKARVSLTALKDVGTLVLASLFNSKPELRNRALKLNSFTTTPAEIQAEFERQAGKEWSVSCSSLEKLCLVEAEACKQRADAALALTLRRIWTEGGTLYATRDNALIGEPGMTSLQELVLNHASPGIII